MLCGECIEPAGETADERGEDGVLLLLKGDFTLGRGLCGGVIIVFFILAGVVGDDITLPRELALFELRPTP